MLQSLYSRIKGFAENIHLGISVTVALTGGIAFLLTGNYLFTTHFLAETPLKCSF